VRSLLAVALLVTLAPAAPVPKALKKTDDAVLIVGRWKPAVRGDTVMFDFSADGVVKLWHEGGDRVVEYQWTLDTSAAPKRMRWAGVTAPGVCWECVYELAGDSLKIAYAGTPPTKVAPDTAVVFWDQVRDTSAK
jgi:uncharacterized protein (TIGR03067 family)